MGRVRWAVYLALLVVHPATPQEIAPPDVYVQTLIVRDELELIRTRLGSPRDERAPIDVTRAAPREVFFQALTLFKKSNRFCFEIAREQAEPPPIPAGEIRPAHVYGVVRAARTRLQRVSDHLGLIDAPPLPARDPDKNPTDVFRSIVQANRQLNLLLDRPFAPSDVYQQVTRAISYAYGLRARFPGTRMPDTPGFVADKTPADVYARLLACLDHLREITRIAGIEMLAYAPRPDDIERATPSDVYDIAALVTSEIQYLHSKVGGPVYEAYYPGDITPSHVYQRAGLLQAQLVELKGLLRDAPRLAP